MNWALENSQIWTVEGVERDTSILGEWGNNTNEVRR